ncbi:general secretion pathway protein D [Luteimonas cucumeris]|uniref:General secretion pathway protein D n=1 Tax=Luteimonas cucumeris TaxID=985012 RepID=A0A562LBP4_9GAMM|nr:type II secretion system secretin GspD [Luteimonas cucumeris]TWI05050.1 general secretion pathway protein D [Luteimonas cucumeris]
MIGLTRPQPKIFLSALLCGMLAACATVPRPDVRREGAMTDAATTATTADGRAVQTEPMDGTDAGPRPVVRRGSGQMINRGAASASPPSLGSAVARGEGGSTTFNFEGESLHAVVKAVLGDMLGQNYVIAPGVQGTVTFATPKPVDAAQALSLLEMVLGWNNARMVYGDGRYSIVPADQALAGAVAPRIGAPGMARGGYQVQVVPLRYVSATEMEKLLKPYARPNAIVNVESSRNLITLAGTRAELANYLRTIEIFDVDWLSGMSVGVFPLQSGNAAKVATDLEKVFGEQSKSPVAGMFRFMPLEGANAVLAITSQPDYLDDIGDWIDRIDGVGDTPRLFSYELKYIKADDLATRLAEVFGSQRGGNGGDSDPSLMYPDAEQIRGLADNMSPTSKGDPNSSDIGSSSGMGGGSGIGSGNGTLNLNPEQRSSNTTVTLEVDGDRVGVSAVQETNALLVRASPAAWRSIRDVIERLDVMPMQVHIEAQVAEVKLSGELSYGVNWFFEKAVTDAGLPDAVGRTTWSTLAGSITPGGLGWTFLGRNAAAVIEALDQVTDVKLLQTPSVVVRNNAEATFNVGSRIPISSVSINPGNDSDNTISQVQYIETGTILKVRPRVTKDGMVFLDIVQEISTPGSQADADQNGNVRIDTRRLKTEAAIQSGETIMLAGLISDGVDRGSSGVPGLSRIPIIGGLFGTQRSNTSREEVIVLLTPSIIRNPQEARDLTDEYGRRFRAMEPLKPVKQK